MEATLSPSRWNHEQTGPTETVESLIRRGMTSASLNGLTLSPSKVARMVRRHVRESVNLHDASRTLDAYFLSYADPTGDTAVRNLMRGGASK